MQKPQFSFEFSQESLDAARNNKFVKGGAIIGGAVAVNAAFAQSSMAQTTAPSVSDPTSVDSIVTQANAMITAVGGLGTAAFLVTLVPVAGVYVVRMFKMMVLGS